MLLFEEVKKHIFRYGFVLTYQTWIHHDETPTSSSHTSQYASELIEEMVAIFDDIAREADFDDIGTSTIEDGPFENEFKDLLTELQQKLYPGCI